MTLWVFVAALCSSPARSNDDADSSLFGPHFGEVLAAAAFDKVVGWHGPGDCYGPKEGESYGTGLTAKCEVLRRVPPREGTVANPYDMPLSLKCPDKGSGQLALIGVLNRKYVNKITVSGVFKDGYVLPQSLDAQVIEPDHPIDYKKAYEFDVTKIYKEYSDGKRRDNDDDLKSVKYNLGLMSNVYNTVCIGSPKTKEQFFKLLKYYRSLLPPEKFPIIFGRRASPKAD